MLIRIVAPMERIEPQNSARGTYDDLFGQIVDTVAPCFNQGDA